MRRTRPASFVLGLSSAALALALAGCSDTTTPGTTTLSAAEVSEIGAAEGDEVEQAVGALTTPLADGSIAPTAPGCATVNDETDSDGDLAPDDATYTFALPACSFTGFRGGTLEITGTITLSDPTPAAADLAVTATLTDFAFRYTSPDAARTYSAVRNGTRTLTGNAQGASLSNAVTLVRSAPGRADATVVHNLLLSFTPAAGGHLAF